jgi:two-component sensor histidine kinase
VWCASVIASCAVSDFHHGREGVSLPMKSNAEIAVSDRSAGIARRWWRVVLVVVAVWTFFGLLSASQMYANTYDERSRFAVSRILQLTVYNAWLLAVITIPLIFVLAFASDRVRQKKLLALVYGSALAALILLHSLLRPLVVPFVLTEETTKKTYSYGEKFIITLRSFYVSDIWICCCILLAFLAWRLAEEARFRSLREERLQTKLARAELQVLKMQLQPHFLFNTLNTIYNLAPQNSRKAQLMISRLADLLRLSLEHVSTNTVPLQREIEFLNSYVDIEKTRFEERLTVNIDVAPETLDALVPNMILQPLVENAIRHGVSKKAAGGTVSISSQRIRDRLQLSISDDGRLSPIQSGGGGIGLANIRARLTQLYGNDFHFDLVPSPEGTRVVLELPFQLMTAKVETNEVI